MTHTGIAREPKCPRCRYDLCGAVAAWSEACPCDGICPECGFGFTWADVLRMDRQRDERFIEHTKNWRSLPRAAVRTWWMTLRPAKFWGWVKLHHEISVRRMLLWLVMMTVPLWALSATMEMVNAELYTRAASPMGTPVGRSTYSRMSAWDTLLNCWSAPMVYFEASSGMARMGYLPGVIVVEDGDVYYMTIRHIPAEIRFLAAAQTMWVVMVAVLPATRRRAKVNWRHLCRAYAYSWSWVVVVLLAIAGYQAFEMYMMPTASSLLMTPSQWTASTDESISRWLSIASGGWLLRWWWVVIVRSWRLPQGWLVWGMLLIPVALASVLAVVLPYAL